MLSESFLIQLLTLLVSFIYVKLSSSLALWYAAGLYLILLGLIMLLLGGDIFVGFLWVIDFGVGLIFFIFILHFSTFLHQKSHVNVFHRFTSSLLSLTLVYLSLLFFLLPTSFLIGLVAQLNKLLVISWYNFYESFVNFNISHLQLLREIYFFNNSFEFFLINFVLLYGIFLAVILCFMLKKFFTVSTVAQTLTLKLLRNVESSYFIRQQNFLRQQNSSTGTRVWKKKINKHDI